MDLRLTETCPVFGEGKDLSHRCLPTYEDVMKYYQYTRLKLKKNNLNLK